MKTKCSQEKWWSVFLISPREQSPTALSTFLPYWIHVWRHNWNKSPIPRRCTAMGSAKRGASPGECRYAPHSLVCLQFLSQFFNPFIKCRRWKQRQGWPDGYVVVAENEWSNRKQKRVMLWSMQSVVSFILTIISLFLICEVVLKMCYEVAA